jgi:hypothetical protein
MEQVLGWSVLGMQGFQWRLSSGLATEHFGAAADQGERAAVSLHAGRARYRRDAGPQLARPAAVKKAVGDEQNNLKVQFHSRVCGCVKSCMGAQDQQHRGRVRRRLSRVVGPLVLRVAGLQSLRASCLRCVYAGIRPARKQVQVPRQLGDCRRVPNHMAPPKYP